jgi:tRNA pseudouridine55 synthase
MMPDLEKGETWLIDKPYEWTSFDIVRKLKYALICKTGQKKAKIGHAGTLDPLATGLLIVCIGKATKSISSIQAQEKEYTGTFFLGATTPSFDRETEVTQSSDISSITNDQIEEARKSFLGEQDQLAPVYSAKLIDGKRAYEHARKGEEKELTPHSITIKEFEITRIELPEIDFRIVCSKGTYIRSIARDFGVRLGSGAYLYDLRRTRIGSYHVKDAQSINDLWKELTDEEMKETVSRRAFLLENRRKP